MSTDSTAITFYLRMQKAEQTLLEEKLEGELRWLEGSISSIRADKATGKYHEESNLVPSADAVARTMTKLKLVIEQRAALETIAAEHTK